MAPAAQSRRGMSLASQAGPAYHATEDLPDPRAMDLNLRSDTWPALSAQDCCDVGRPSFFSLHQGGEVGFWLTTANAERRLPTTPEADFVPRPGGGFVVAVRVYGKQGGQPTLPLGLALL